MINTLAIFMHKLVFKWNWSVYTATSLVSIVKHLNLKKKKLDINISMKCIKIHT